MGEPFDTVLADMETEDIGEYLFEPGVCVPGMDNFSSIARDVIKNLEQ